MSTELSSRLLIVDDDDLIRAVIQDALSQMGYDCALAADLEQAMRALHRQPVDLLVTDAFSHTAHDVLAACRPLLQLAHPLPVVLCTGWPLTSADLQEAEFAAVLRKPFALDELVTTVAECLERPFSATQLRQAEIIRSFLTALEAWDGVALGVLMNEKVVVYPWFASPYPAAHQVVGRSAALDYAREMGDYFGPVRLLDTHLSACPQGTAARFLFQWRLSDDIPQQQIMCLCFQFDDRELIAQIGHPRQDAFPHALLDAAEEQQRHGL